jgi:hypothetical protein
MVIRQDFSITSQLPPRLFMEQIMDSLSKVYCYLWDNKNALNQIELSWHKASRIFSRKTIRTSLRKLSAQGLLDYQEDEDGVTIELVGWDEIVSAL